ncbi:hypothetical protein CFD26_106796 [Aspergillus turcosus]|uniref:alpha-galactosidase n=1 Tax=Aspergillus turcosus TaxID=1245748 RepID=A0A421DA14_9EURO|nr:hypothetical protein CFD26_106796 [Aspergillus turcosus]
MAQQAPSANAIVVEGKSFALNRYNVSYRFHIDESTGDLRSDHFRGRVSGPIPNDPAPIINGWTGMPDRVRREFPDQGRGDFRVPAIRIRQSQGHTVSAFRYDSHAVVAGKPALPGLPATFGTEEVVTTLVVHLYDQYNEVAADLMYSVFEKYDAIVRSEYNRVLIPLAQPFITLAHHFTTESQGKAWGFSLVYTGSFAANVKKGSQGLTRVSMGVHPDQLSWPLALGGTLTSPECVSVYSKDGLGGMSRSLHRLYRNHPIKSKFATDNRPVLLNSWEGLYFDINQENMYRMAQESAALGVKLFVMDDGWFGDKYPRVSDAADITSLEVANSSEKLRFGIPEMVNPESSLYHEHPDWVLHAAITNILNSADISYVKWDHNRLSTTPSPAANLAYMLGMYRVFDTLTSRFPDILREGWASGGGRFDPGILQYFPQAWTSDDTDAVERIFIQMGTSLVYPASAMGAHISAVPDHQTGRTVPLTFRAHVAMMGGSFGLELDPLKMLPDEKAAVPGLIALAEKVNPVVLKGDMWRLNLPEESN